MGEDSTNTLVKVWKYSKPSLLCSYKVKSKITSFSILILCYLAVSYLGLAWSESETESGSCYAQHRTNIAIRFEKIRTTLEVITERVFSKYYYTRCYLE